VTEVGQREAAHADGTDEEAEIFNKLFLAAAWRLRLWLCGFCACGMRMGL